LWQYLGRMGWKASGPVREIYLVAPGSVRDWSELLTEVQVAVSGS
jgi:effector-binding domain-containing protein